MTIEEAQREVFKQKKRFGEIIDVWKDKTWLDYYTQPFADLGNPSDALLSAVRAETEHIFGPRVGEDAALALKDKRWVSTADHHGLLCHPYFYSSNIAQSDPSVRGDINVHIAFTFGNISLSNDSFPRGFFFRDAQFQEHRFAFKSLKEKNIPVYALTPCTRERFLHEYERLAQVPLARRARERLEELLKTFLNDVTVWSQPTYSAQLTVMSQLFWNRLFGDERGTLVYLEIDSVVRRLLIERHLVTNTNIYRILFDPAWRDAYLRYMDGVPGAHTATAGTHFFWYIDRIRGMRRSLRVQDGVLRTEDSDVSLPLSPEALATALVDRTIVPGTALLLLIVHGEEGLTCAGGVSQLDYLELMMERWNTLIASFTDSPSSVTNTGILSGEQSLLGIESKDGIKQVASLMDILLYSDTPQALVQKTARETLIIDTHHAMLPTLYWLVTRNRYTAEHDIRVPCVTHVGL